MRPSTVRQQNELLILAGSYGIHCILKRIIPLKNVIFLF